MAASLKISVTDAGRVIAVLEMQGYVNRFKEGEWMTTFAGESISGSKSPRYTRERVDEALTALRGRIAQANRDSGAPYKITTAVAFGDFLADRTRFQSPEVGVRLEPRKQAAIAIVRKHATQQQFLRELRGKSALIHIHLYEPWMSARTHRDLLR